MSASVHAGIPQEMGLRITFYWVGLQRPPKPDLSTSPQVLGLETCNCMLGLQPPPCYWTERHLYNNITFANYVLWADLEHALEVLEVQLTLSVLIELQLHEKLITLRPRHNEMSFLLNIGYVSTPNEHF